MLVSVLYRQYRQKDPYRKSIQSAKYTDYTHNTPTTNIYSFKNDRYGRL